jgi:hypothetical protein
VPELNTPADKVAVSPVTPVEFTIWPAWLPPFPPEYGTELVTLLDTTPAVSVPELVEDAQFKAVIDPTGTTVLVRVQVLPPMFKAKLAVPAEEGVPVIEYVTLPEPEAKFPESKVAVNPVTPVELTICPVWAPPLPPVYGTALLTFTAETPIVNVPVLLEEVQFKAVIEPTANTVRDNVQVLPPMFSAKFAVPDVDGVPLMV